MTLLKERAGHWSSTRLALALGLVAIGVLATLDAWLDIGHIAWVDEESSQVWLAPAVMVWLIAARRDQFAAARPSTSWLGPVMIAAGWLAGWWGYHNAMQSLWHGGAVLVVIGCFLTFAGWDVLRRFWPAFVVLAFMVPVPGRIRDQIAGPLQTATAASTEVVLDMLGIFVHRSGNVLTYNGVDVAVAEACNGMRMVFVLVLVCYAVAFASPLRPSVRALILVASPICAIVCNVIRLVPTVWVYGYYSETWAPTFHDLSGWAMIGVAFLLVMGVIRLLRWIELPVMQVEAVDDGAARGRSAAVVEGVPGRV